MTGWLVEITFTKPYHTDTLEDDDTKPGEYTAWGHLVREDDKAYYLATVLSPQGAEEVITEILKAPNTKVKQIAKVNEADPNG